MIRVRHPLSLRKRSGSQTKPKKLRSQNSFIFEFHAPK